MPSFVDLINLACPGLSANANDIVIHPRKLKEALLALDGVVAVGQGSVGAAVAKQVAVYNGVNSTLGYADLTFDPVTKILTTAKIVLTDASGSITVSGAGHSLNLDAGEAEYGVNLIGPDGLGGTGTLGWGNCDTPEAGVLQLTPVIVNGDLGGPTNKWRDLNLSGSLKVGATPFEFKEDAGVLQLGVSGLQWDVANSQLVVSTDLLIGVGFSGSAFFDASATDFGLNFIAPDGLGSNCTLQWTPLDTPEAGICKLAPSFAVADLGAVASPWRTGYFGTSVVIGSTPFTFTESSPGVLQLGDANLKYDAGQTKLQVAGGVFSAWQSLGADTDEVALNTLGVQRNQSGAAVTTASFSIGVVQDVAQAGSVIEFKNGTLTSWVLGSDADANPSVLYPNIANAYDFGAVGNEIRTGYFGTSIVSPVSVLTPMTTAARDALVPANGWIIYNSTTDKFQGRAAGAWADLN